MPTILPPTKSGLLPVRTSAPESLQKSRPGLLRRLVGWRYRQLLKRALRQAGDPNLVLDLPCGNGRFWPLLARHPNRLIIAADNSAEKLAQAQALQSPAIVERVRLLQTSAFAINLPANAVECVFCMRLFHRLASSKQRLAMLAELHRVTSDSAILSVNLHSQSEAATNQPPSAMPGLLLQLPAIVSEFGLAGFSINSYHDLLPGYSNRRIYVLRKEYKK